MLNLYELQDIVKEFRGKMAIFPLNLAFREGELTAVIGPSGAGKTTLLNILARVLEPDGGMLFLDGKPIQEYKDAKEFAKKVGVMRQQFDLVEQLTVINNVLAGRLNEWNLWKSLLSLILPQDKNIAIRALEKVGLADMAYKRTGELSGGEKQRVAIARLLVQNPKIILADEPVSSLDPVRAEDVLKTLVSLTRADNKSLVAVLHSVDYAKKYFDRIIGMKDGRVIFDFPVSDVTEVDLEGLYRLKERY